MAAFVTNIQPTLMEANQGHIPHHHQSGQHSSFLPHSGHNLPSPPTTHGHHNPHTALGQPHHGARTPSKEHYTPIPNVDYQPHPHHHPPQHYEDFAIIHHQYAGGEILSPPHTHSPAHLTSNKEHKHHREGHHQHHHVSLLRNFLFTSVAIFLFLFSFPSSVKKFGLLSDITSALYALPHTTLIQLHGLIGI